MLRAFGTCILIESFHIAEHIEVQLEPKYDEVNNFFSSFFIFLIDLIIIILEMKKKKD